MVRRTGRSELTFELTSQPLLFDEVDLGPEELPPLVHYLDLDVGFVDVLLVLDQLIQ